MKIVIEWYQQQVGIQESVLRYLGRINYVYCPWLTELREFLQKTNTWLNIPSLWTPTPQREGDGCVMDRLQEAHHLNLAQVNSTRLFYKILYLSDITTMDGRTIIQVQNSPTRETLGRESKLPWPHQ